MTVTCTRCGKPAEGNEVPTRGLYMCLTCQLVTDPAPPPPVFASGPRRKWPWLVLAAVMAAGAGAAVFLAKQRHAREMLEMRYPIAATREQAAVLATEAAKWRKGKSALLASLRAFQPSQLTESSAPCPLSLALPSEAAYETTSSMDEKLRSARDRDPNETLVLVYVAQPTLAEVVSDQLETLLATADRARFHSVRGRHLAVAAISMPAIVMVLDENTAPALTDQDMVIEGANLGRRKAFVPGHRIGTAYVFDKQTGKLACAGRFEASSSDSVGTVQSKWGSLDMGGNENDALELDFESNTVAAIASAVRAI